MELNKKIYSAMLDKAIELFNAMMPTFEKIGGSLSAGEIVAYEAKNNLKYPDPNQVITINVDTFSCKFPQNILFETLLKFQKLAKEKPFRFICAVKEEEAAPVACVTLPNIQKMGTSKIDFYNMNFAGINLKLGEVVSVFDGFVFTAPAAVTHTDQSIDFFFLNLADLARIAPGECRLNVTTEDEKTIYILTDAIGATFRAEEPAKFCKTYSDFLPKAGHEFNPAILSDKLMLAKFKHTRKSYSRLLFVITPNSVTVLHNGVTYKRQCITGATRLFYFKICGATLFQLSKHKYSRAFISYNEKNNALAMVKKDDSLLFVCVNAKYSKEHAYTSIPRNTAPLDAHIQATEAHAEATDAPVCRELSTNKQAVHAANVSPATQADTGAPTATEAAPATMNSRSPHLCANLTDITPPAISVVLLLYIATDIKTLLLLNRKAAAEHHTTTRQPNHRAPPGKAQNTFAPP